MQQTALRAAADAERWKKAALRLACPGARFILFTPAAGLRMTADVPAWGLQFCSWPYP
jgi:hypothetical protein